MAQRLCTIYTGGKGYGDQGSLKLALSAPLLGRHRKFPLLNFSFLSVRILRPLQWEGKFWSL